MKSENLDIVIEKKGRATWIYLHGAFHVEEMPNITSKIDKLLSDGNALIIVNMEEVTTIDSSVVKSFLTLLNNVREKGGELKLVFQNPQLWHMFTPYRLLFTIYPDEKSAAAHGIFGRLRQRGKTLRRKTGVRLSGSLAIFILAILCGWFITLAIIIHMQHQRIETQLSRIEELKKWKQHTRIEMEELRTQIKPIKDLGLIPDTLESP